MTYQPASHKYVVAIIDRGPERHVIDISQLPEGRTLCGKAFIEARIVDNEGTRFNCRHCRRIIKAATR